MIAELNESLEGFNKQFKQLTKKYPTLKLEVLALIHSLEQNPNQGVLLGSNIYKIRLAKAN